MQFIHAFAITEQLNKLKSGYQEHTTKTEVSHLLYNDYLKLRDKTEEEIQTQMQAVRTNSEDIHMEFGLDKGKKLEIQRGKLVHSQNLIFQFNREIQELEHGKHTNT
jgi:hypothetical protein